MIIFDEGQIDQFQGHDYAIVLDAGQWILVMLPHGDADGNMYDRAGKTIISEDALIKLALNVIRPVCAQQFGFNAEDCIIVAAPCYPNAVRKNVKSLDILGDWDSATHCDYDAIDRIIIQSTEVC